MASCDEYICELMKLASPTSAPSMQIISINYVYVQLYIFWFMPKLQLDRWTTVVESCITQLLKVSYTNLIAKKYSFVYFISALQHLEAEGFSKLIQNKNQTIGDSRKKLCPTLENGCFLFNLILLALQNRRKQSVNKHFR